MTKIFRPPFYIHYTIRVPRVSVREKGESKRERPIWEVYDSNHDLVSFFDSEDHARDFLNKMTESYANPNMYNSILRDLYYGRVSINDEETYN